MASSCGFPVRSAADRHLEKLLVAVQTKRKVNLSREVTTADLANLRRTAELFRKVVPLLRVELDKLRATLLGAAAILRVQANPFLETVTHASKRKKKVVTFAADQQTNPFLADSRLEVETNPFISPAVRPIGAGATLPERNLPTAGATLPEWRTSVLKTVPAANIAAVADPKHLEASVQAVSMQAGSPERKKKVVMFAVDQQEVETNPFPRPAVHPIGAQVTLPDRKLPESGATLPGWQTSVVKTVPAAAKNAVVADPKHSGASVEAVSVQAGSPEMKKKVITFAVNQQRPMVVQNAHQLRAPVKCPENKPQKSRQRPRRRRPSLFRPPVSQPKLDTASANQFIEKQIAVPLPPCYFCGGKHTLCRCSDFFFLRLAEREDFVQQMKLCVNCFSQRHNASSCRDKPRCLRCPQWHHTLLHRNV